MSNHVNRVSLFLCTGLLVGCQTASVAPTPVSAGALPTLAGDANAVAALTPALARKGLQMHPVPSTRAEAVAQYCSGGADVLALSSDMDDSEITACAAAGGHWSAVASEGLSLYLSREFNAQHNAFDWWG